LLRYVVVGSLNTAASFGAYSLLLYAGWSYPLASLGSLIFGICLSFLTLGRYVFLSRLRGRFLKFIVVWSILYIANLGLIAIVLKFGAGPYMAGLLAAAPTVGLAYLSQKFYVFR